MNISTFVARRISFRVNKGFTKVIINIGIAAVALAVTVLIVATSLFKGFKTEISNKVFGFWGHIHISDANTKRTFESISIDYDTLMVQQIKDLEQITYQSKSDGFWIFGGDDRYSSKETYGGVKDIYPFIVSPAIIDTKDEFEGILLRGLNQDYNWNQLKDFKYEGRWIDFEDSLSNREIVISSTTSNRIGKSIGDQFVVSFIQSGKQIKKRLEIVGIYKTGIEEYDKQFAIVDMSLLQEALGWAPNEIAGYELTVEHLEDMGVLNEYIYIEELPSRLYSETIVEKFPNIFDWLEIQDVNEWVLFLLMAIVSVITMITTYLILILERTQTIGVLKALGATNRSVIQIFLYCAGFIIIRGIIIGNVVGLLICSLQYYFRLIRLNEENYLLDFAPIVFNWPMYLIINVGIIVVTLVFLLIPSFLISKISPTKILRFN